VATKVQLESKVKALEQAYKLETKERQKAEAKCRRLEKNRDELHLRITRLAEMVRDTDALARNAVEHRERLQEELKQSKKEYDGCLTALQSARTRYHNLEQELVRCSNELTTAQSQYTELFCKHEQLEHHFEKQVENFLRERDEARHKNVELITENGNLNSEVDRQKRRACELEIMLNHIAGLCEHRSKVSHSVLLFECDADGNRLIVPEEVRFLREIHEICNKHEIPF
jgi:chromosome segregation ATPase